jgi:autotransporter-associated beta strand protein
MKTSLRPSEYLCKSSLLRSLLVPSVASLASAAFAFDGTWNVNTAGNWSDTANWNNGVVASDAGFTASFIANLRAGRTITLDQDVTIGHLYFENTYSYTYAFTLSGGKTLTLDTNGSGGTSIINVASGFSSAVIGGNSLVLAGSGGIEKTGAGSLTLNTDNENSTFTGPVLISEGRLTLGSSGTRALKGVNVTLGGGDTDATFAVSANANTTYNVGSITVAAAGSGTATFSYGSGFTATVSSGITLDKDMTVDVTASGGVLFLSGIISGSGGITKTGGYTLRLSGTNTYEGGTTFGKGAIRLTNSKGLGTGPLTIGDADSGSSNLNLYLGHAAATVSNDIHVTDNGTGAVTINTLSSNDGGSTGTKTLGGKLQIDRDINIQATRHTTANVNITVSGVISGIGGVTTTSLSNTKVTFTGANTYTGGTFVAGGTLATDSTGGTFGTGDVTVEADASLYLGNSSSIADSATLFFNSTSLITLGYSDTEIEIVSALARYSESVVGTYTYIDAGTYTASDLNSYFDGNYFTGTGSLQVVAVPEPAVCAVLAGLATLGFVALRRRR